MGITRIADSDLREGSHEKPISNGNFQHEGLWGVTQGEVVQMLSPYRGAHEDGLVHRS